MKTDQLANALKALGHPKRLEIFRMIVSSNTDAGFNTACECPLARLMQKLKIGAPTVSHHLKELRNANLIVTERRGKNIFARINSETYAAVMKALSLDQQ